MAGHEHMMDRWRDLLSPSRRYPAVCNCENNNWFKSKRNDFLFSLSSLTLPHCSICVCILSILKLSYVPWPLFDCLFSICYFFIQQVIRFPGHLFGRGLFRSACLGFTHVHVCDGGCGSCLVYDTAPVQSWCVLSDCRRQENGS